MNESTYYGPSVVVESGAERLMNPLTRVYVRGAVPTVTFRLPLPTDFLEGRAFTLINPVPLACVLVDNGGSTVAVVGAASYVDIYLVDGAWVTHGSGSLNT